MHNLAQEQVGNLGTARAGSILIYLMDKLPSSLLCRLVWLNSMHKEAAGSTFPCLAAQNTLQKILTALQTP